MMAIRPSSETVSAGPEQDVTTIQGSAGVMAGRTPFELVSEVTDTVTMDETEFSRAERESGSKLIREKL